MFLTVLAVLRELSKPATAPNSYLGGAGFPRERAGGRWANFPPEHTGVGLPPGHSRATPSGPSGLRPEHATFNHLEEDVLFSTIAHVCVI